MNEKRANKKKLPGGSRRLEAFRPDMSELATLFSSLGKNELEILQQLQTHEPQIQSWLEADPTRIELLKKDPQNVIKKLLIHLDLAEMEVSILKLPEGWSMHILKERNGVVGQTLFNALWSYVNLAPENAEAFHENPLAVVDEVALQTKAPSAERTAVREAIMTVLNLHELQVLPLTELIQSRLPTAVANSPIGGIYLRQK